MVTWLYCIVGYEPDILPHFLRHYAGKVEKITLVDNGMGDEGVKLARSFANVTLRPSPFRGAVDELGNCTLASELCREARGKADWVLWVDCDEFLWGGDWPLAGLLRFYRDLDIRAVKACGYQMLADSFPAGDAPLVETVRTGARDREYDKMCAIDPALDVLWSPGHHNSRVTRPSTSSGGRDVKPYRGELKLLHYRYFGAEYLAARNARNYAHLTAADKKAGRGYQVYPDYATGKYSATWFESLRAQARDVVTDDEHLPLAD